MTIWDAIGDALEQAGHPELAEVARGGRPVFVLHEGDYSDRSLVGVFSSRENALAIGKGDDIEECPVDDLLAWVEGPVYTVHLMIESETPGSWLDFPADEGQMRHPRRCRWMVLGRDHERYIAVTSPVSPGHAHKVAVEKRQELLRTGQYQGMLSGALMATP